MNYLRADCSKGQMKIQEMAFVLVALMIFFGLIALAYFAIKMNEMNLSVDNLKEKEARETVRKIASSPEFAWTATNCQNCIDVEKVLIMRDREVYKELINLDYLAIEVMYPLRRGECSKANFPECKTITILKEEGKSFGTLQGAYVNLCRYDNRKGNYVRCDIGKIYASMESLT